MVKQNSYTPNCSNTLIETQYGCLEVMDDGSEFLHLIESKISSINDEKSEFILAIQDNKLTHDDRYWNYDGKVISPAYIYEPVNFKAIDKSVCIDDFDEAISKLLKRKEIKHYKCKCKKCGKIRYYSLETLQTNPQFCYRPMYCSSSFSYSVRSQNATYRKKQKYQNNDSVCFVYDKDEVIPSEEYCDKWNDKRRKELKKQSEKDASIIAALPRRFAKNYDKNFVGLKYESLEILECINDKLESIPEPHYNQRHKKLYGDVTVYKQYRCRCYLCGKEQIVTCDKFGIHPPTQYGYRAYGGYWSDIYCDCHPISSFQWIVNKLLIENNVPYQVEYSFQDLYGIYGKNKLKFDFAILNNDASVKCLIECQGEQHYMPVEEFGGNDCYDIQVENDNLKKMYVEKQNIQMIEISYKDKKYEKVEDILKKHKII